MALVQIVSGHVLDDLAAGLGDGAVRQHDCHAKNEVAEAAVLEAQGAAVVAGGNAADRGAFGPEGIEGDDLAVLGEDCFERVPWAPGLDGAGHVLPGVLTQGRHAAKAEHNGRADRIAPLQLGAGAGGGHGQSILIGEAQNLRDFGGRRGSYGDGPTFQASVLRAGDGGKLRAGLFGMKGQRAHQNSSAMPAVSSGCGV